MAPARPMLGDIELQHVQKIEVDGYQVLVQHGIPALEGDFLQGLGRRATQITLTGVLTGPEAADGLKTLRDKFRAAEPVSFVADITTATQVDQVLIEQMDVRELAGKPERFEYAFTLREFIPPPEPEEELPEIEEPENPAEDIDQGVGILIVEVSVEDRPSFDFSNVTLTVRGTQEDGTELSRTLSNRTDNTWTEEEFPGGQYTVEAVASASAAITGSAPADVQAGKTTRINVTLHPGAIIARAFVIHFRFDSAFIEPCMRSVLQAVARYALDPAHESEKLLIVGHTDKVDTEDYNQSLSERRARSAHAFLTVGRDRDAALAEWHALRQERTRRQIPEIKDDWGVREYQHMLQDLYFYSGPVDGNHGSLTDDAVRAYRCQKGLPPGTNVDNAVWQHLIEDYLTQDSLSVPANRFLPNASTGCDGGVLKWLGCGENSPLPQPRPTRRTAWRPYRRVEFLFVASNALPDGCMAPEPATFNLPQQGAVADRWCLGPGDPDNRCCFGTYTCDQARTGQWCIRRTVDEQTITVDVFVHDEDDNPVGNRKFVLIAPDGQFKANETTRGEPLPARTNSNGRLTFQDMPVGVYTLEMTARRRGDYVLIRLSEGSYEDAKGNVVCKRLTPGDNSLEVVIIDAPVLREIKLPVAAHLMTALHPTTHEIRTCPDPLDPNRQIFQQTNRTPDEVRALFDAANRIWRRARIRFEVDIIQETYSHSGHPQCAVGSREFADILNDCAYPNVVNVFFFGVLEAAGEAGVHTSAQFLDAQGNVIRTVEGIAIGDKVLLKLFTNVPPVPTTPDQNQSIIILSHELGHYLNLEHADDTPANAGRLMLPNLVTGNETLIADEVQRARGSGNAARECVPLSLRVTGAHRIGGRHSHQYLTLQNPSGTVTIDAQISDKLIDPQIGSVSMSGGDHVVNAIQHTVSTATTRVREIVATYIPEGDGNAVTTRVVIRVVTFSLHVTGNNVRQVDGAGSTTFVTTRHPSEVVRIEARIFPAPFCVPNDMVTWSRGDDTADPLRKTLSRANIAQTTVEVTLAGTTRTVTIRVIEIEITNNVAPFNTPVARVQTEGVLNSARTAFDIGDLFATQRNSVFRARADIPGVGEANIGATLTSYSPAGPQIERVNITLTRHIDDRFVSPPFLAIPSAILRADVTTGEGANALRIIRCQAGGRLRLELDGNFAGLAVVEKPVRGRVVYIAAQAFDGSGVSEADIQRHFSRANRVWTQAGIEVKERSVADSVAAPAGLLDLDHNVPFNGILTAEERRLVGLDPNGPARSATATDLNVYYVDNIRGPAVGAAYSHEGYRAIIDPDHSAIAVEIPDSVTRSVADRILAHEIGHQLIINWGGSEHQDRTGDDWPSSNVMYRRVSDGNDLDRTQVENILRSARLGNNPFIIIEQ